MLKNLMRVYAAIIFAVLVSLALWPRSTYTQSSYSIDDVFLIEGHSMLPSIKNGSSVVIDRDIKFSDLKVGDIVVFHALVNTEYGTGRKKFIKQPVAHRLIEKNGESFVTKGDNNSFVDITTCTENNYLGKVIEVY